MSAPVTEAHRELAKTITGRTYSIEYWAQLIADSEAEATAELKKLADHWCDMHTVCAKEANQLRAECNNLRADLDAIKAIRNEETARAERAEAELADERAIVSRIWVQLGSPTYEQLKGRSIYCLIDELKAELADEAIALRDMMSERDAAEAELAKAKAIIASIEEDGTEEHNAAVHLRQELATERARLDWLLSRMGGNVLPANKCVAWTVDVYHYKNQFPSRAAIDAAIKEENK